MLRPTFLGFEIARRGIFTAQKGMDVTGHNLTNWDSNGYTRQRVDQTAIAASSYSTRFATNRVGVAGQGVNITGIAQIRDSFLDKRYRDECSDVGYYQTAKGILSDIETVIGEFQPLTDTGLRASLKSILDAFQDFAGSPYSQTNANIVRSEFKNLVQTLNQLDAKLTNVAEQHKYDLGISVDQVNTYLEQIANLNKSIQEDLGVTTASNGYYGSNELLDQRNLLLDKLAMFGDVRTTNMPDGSVTVEMNGKTVVEGKKFETMQMFRNNTDSTVSLHWVSTGETVHLTSGSLKAATDFINGRGANVINAGESPERGVLYYRDCLNTFASTLVETINNIVPSAANPDGTPVPGSFKMLLGALSDTPNASGNYVTLDIPITAANISLSEAWLDDASFVIFQEGSLNNNYANEMLIALGSAKVNFVSNGETYTGTFYEYVTNYTAVLAEDITFYSGRYDAAVVIADEMLDRRDEVSGVSTDEETANMMLYQRTFEASARLMTALDEMLDVIINRTGLVGR